jgi:hypothetical protein
MKPDAFVFMILAWGCALGLLAYCIYKLAKNPQVVSVLTNSGNNKKTQDGSGESADE